MIKVTQDFRVDQRNFADLFSCLYFNIQRTMRWLALLIATYNFKFEFLIK